MTKQRFQMKNLFLLGIVLMAASVVASAAKPPADPEEAAIRATALDYIDGYYSGDAARMQRAVHPELAKRIVKVDPTTGKCTLEQLDAGRLIEITRSGAGKIPENLRQEEVTILDRYHDAAAVKIVANEWIDYLEMAKVDGAWKIINVLWALKPVVQAHAETSPGTHGSSDVENFPRHREIGSWGFQR